MSKLESSYVYEVNDNLSGVSSQDLSDQKSISSKEIPLFNLVKNTPVYMEFEKIESPCLENYPSSMTSRSTFSSEKHSTSSSKKHSTSSSEDLFMQKELRIIQEGFDRKKNEMQKMKSSSEGFDRKTKSSSEEEFIESESSMYFNQNEFREDLEERGSILTEYSVSSFIPVSEDFEEDYYNIGDYGTTYGELPKKTKKRHKKCVLL